MALGLGVCKGGTREQCSGNSHNAISSKRVAACPSFSQGTNACFFKQPNCDISIEFSVFHLVSQVWQRTSTTKSSQLGLMKVCSSLPVIILLLVSTLKTHFTSSFFFPSYFILSPPWHFVLFPPFFPP